MTVPTDHLAAAREALDDARRTGPAATRHIARAQVHATLAVAEAIGRLADARAIAEIEAWDDAQGDDGAAS